MQYLNTQRKFNCLKASRTSPDDMVHSSLRFTSSNESQIKEAEAVQYHEVKTEECFKNFYQNIQKAEPKNDSLRYSESPEAHEFKKRISSLVYEDETFGGYTPEWLLEILKERHVLRSQPANLPESLKEKNRQWTPRPPFTSLLLWNPFYRQVERNKEVIAQSLIDSYSTFGKEKEEVQQFFMVPEDLEIIQEEQKMCQENDSGQNQENPEKKNNQWRLKVISEQSQNSSIQKMVSSKERSDQNQISKQDFHFKSLSNQGQNGQIEVKVEDLHDFFKDLNLQKIEIQENLEPNSIESEEVQSVKDQQTNQVENRVAQKVTPTKSENIVEDNEKNVQNPNNEHQNRFSKEEILNNKSSDQNSKKSSNSQSFIKKLDDSNIEKSSKKISNKCQHGDISVVTPQPSQESQREFNTSEIPQLSRKSQPENILNLSFKELNQELVEHIKSIDQMSKSCDARLWQLEVSLEILKADNSKSTLLEKIGQQMKNAFFKEQKKHSFQENLSQEEIFQTRKSWIKDNEEQEQKQDFEIRKSNDQKNEEKNGKTGQIQEENIQQKADQKQTDEEDIEKQRDELKYEESNVQKRNCKESKTHEPIFEEQKLKNETIEEPEEEKRSQYIFLTESCNSFSAIFPTRNYNEEHQEVHQIELVDESKYLKSSGNHLPFTASEKEKILGVFNAENSDIIRKLAITQLEGLNDIGDIKQVQSKYSYGSQNDQNEKVKLQEADLFAKSGFDGIKKRSMEEQEDQNSKTCPHPATEEERKPVELKKLGVFIKDENMTISIHQYEMMEACFNEKSTNFNKVE